MDKKLKMLATLQKMYSTILKFDLLEKCEGLVDKIIVCEDNIKKLGLKNQTKLFNEIIELFCFELKKDFSLKI